jgi:hypothetical protein
MSDTTPLDYPPGCVAAIEMSQMIERMIAKHGPTAVAEATALLSGRGLL